MANELVILTADSKGGFALPKAARGDIAKIDITDVDLVITLKNGDRFLLPNAGIDAMGGHPPEITFSDTTISSAQLLSEVGAVAQLSVDTVIPSSQKAGNLEKEIEKKDQDQEKLEKHVQELKKEIQDLQQKQEHEKAEQEKKHDQDKHADASSLTNNTETSVEKLVQEAKRIEENLHKSDYEYSPPHTFQPPPAPMAAPAGVPPPISMTPFVSITTGNVVGTTIVGSNIYGGGGAVGSEAEALLGPRDPLQFSAATINGTSGDDTIYTSGPLVGNADPTVDRSFNAKEILLNVAGYFTKLNDVVISGVPTGVSIGGAIDQGGGVWVLPSSFVALANPFTIIYNMDSWRGGADSFDLSFQISGQSARGAGFQTTQNFRFLYMDVTDVSQITNPTLIYDFHGQTKQIYVLPTMGQPSIINSGEGNDIIYGGPNVDTVTSGNGNNMIDVAGGNDVLTIGNGNNTLLLGEGNNTSTSGDGSNIITAGDGNNAINSGNGVNTVTLGDGNSVVTVGNGGNIISAGDGANTITAGSAVDTITVGNGNNIVNAGDGNNIIIAGNGNNTLIGGTGNDTLTAGNGNNIFRGGLGTNTITGGTGSNTVDYSLIATAVTVSLISNTATATGLSDSFTGIKNITGSAHDDILTGSAQSNTIHGGAGNDTIVGNGGNDIIYGEDGNDTITGNIGNDTIYAGNGDNTVFTGTSGFDSVYGGTGNNTFISQHAGVAYDGTNGAALTTGQVNTIDYSTDTAGMTINLFAGFGIGGLANGDLYALTPVSGVNSINKIIAGSGADTITDSNADDNINGGNGNNTFNINGGNDTVTGGSGNDNFNSFGSGTKTYTGGTGTNTFQMGIGSEHLVLTSGFPNVVKYNTSVSGLIINLDSVSHSFVNSAGTTISVGASSGTGWGVTASDLNSYAIGDTFTQSTIGTLTTSNFNDVVWGTTNNLTIDLGTGTDFYFGGNGAESIRMSDNDRVNGGAGGDSYVGNSSANLTMYLDATADINGNGIADYIDKGISLTVSAANSPTGSALTYTGFAQGAGGTDLLINIEHLAGSSGNDFLVGDGSANTINGAAGTNTIYGMGGNDTIHMAFGSDIVDGGSGTDTIDFTNSFFSPGVTTQGVQAFLADASFISGSDKDFYFGTTNSSQVRTGSSTFSSVVNVENITGSAFDDVLYGNSSANTIKGGTGNDNIAGNGGADSLSGEVGNDRFYITSSQLAAVTLLDGGADTDTVKVTGLTSLSAGGISNTKYNSIEIYDVRDSASGGSYHFNANDITNLADNGTSSSVTLQLDTGDTFSPTVGATTGALSFLIASSNSTDTVYYFYSDASHSVADTTNRVAVLDVHVGA